MFPESKYDCYLRVATATSNIQGDPASFRWAYWAEQPKWITGMVEVAGNNHMSIFSRILYRQQLGNCIQVVWSRVQVYISVFHIIYYTFYHFNEVWKVAFFNDVEHLSSVLGGWKGLNSLPSNHL